MADHIKFKRERAISSRRKINRPFPRVPAPADLEAFFKRTRAIIKTYKERPSDDEMGFDERKLVKLKFAQGITADTINAIPGLEFVDQDDDGIIVALMTERALGLFEERLSALAEGEDIKHAEVLYALQEMDNWTSDNRTGWRLKTEGVPAGAKFLIDVELWSQDGNRAQITKMRLSFEENLRDEEIVITDQLANSPYYRLEIKPTQLGFLLAHRDVRKVDLLPDYGITQTELDVDVQDMPEVEAPANDAGSLVILDTGLNTNHPLMGPAIGEAVSFLPLRGPEDINGHGTAVASVGLYRDLKAAIDANSFVPRVHIFSGKVIDDDGKYSTKIIINSVEEAVQYFTEEYDCKVFNISCGDPKFPFTGSRLHVFAVELDRMARQYNVLFVVSAGNVDITQFFTQGEIQDLYPKFLNEAVCKIIDPATAVNVITVGSMAEYDGFPPGSPHINEVALAKKYQPSPFTRTGPSIRGAIKPDFVDYGGNACYDKTAVNKVNRHLLGHAVCNHKYMADGNLFKLVCGTSFAAPRVAHLAARLDGLLPNVNSNTLRAIMGAHTINPLNDAMTKELLTALDDPELKHVKGLYGYGQINDEWLFTSGDEAVTLYAEDAIGSDENHFFEIPMPDEFLNGKQRRRQYSVALSHSPGVRQARLDYTATRISFKLKVASSLEEVSNAFSDRDSAIKMDEDTIGKIVEGLGVKGRGKGSLQVSHFEFKGNPRRLTSKKLFLVVTRFDRGWAKPSRGDVNNKEPYSIALHFRDREAAQANLYASIQAKLGLRLPIRGRGQARATN